MSREIRRVPENWEHPKNRFGDYTPMYQRSFDEVLKDFHEELEKWIQDYKDFENGKVFGEGESWERSKKNGDLFTDYADLPVVPDPYIYMGYGEWYQLYSTISEGTPLSPPFATQDELKKHLIENGDFNGRKWSKEGIENLFESGSLPSFVLSGGRIYSPEEQHLIN